MATAARRDVGREGGAGDPVKALTLIQPWDWAVCFANKRVENRSWAPPRAIIGQRIALHRGVKFDREDAQWLREEIGGEVPSKAEPGGIVATFSVVGFTDAPRSIQRADQLVYAFGPCCWFLADVQVLARPVPCRGAPGLWDLPLDVERAVFAQVGPHAPRCSAPPRRSREGRSRDASTLTAPGRGSSRWGPGRRRRSAPSPPSRKEGSNED